MSRQKNSSPKRGNYHARNKNEKELTQFFENLKNYEQEHLDFLNGRVDFLEHLLSNHSDDMTSQEIGNLEIEQRHLLLAKKFFKLSAKFV